MNECTVYCRIRKGMPIEDALTKPVRRQRRVKINGKNYRSLAAACRATGIDVGTVRHRLKTGMSLREALTKPAREKISIRLNGVKYNSILEACEKTNLSPEEVCDLVKVEQNPDGLIRTMVKKQKTRKLVIDTED